MVNSYKRRNRRKFMAEINLVPYIDVMLVLLVIFMMTAQLLTQGVDVQLPQAAAQALSSKQEPPIVVSVNRDGEYFLNTAADPTNVINAQDLTVQVAAALQLAKQRNQHREVYVKGDRAVDYGKVVEAMVLLQKAGAAHVGLITEPGDDTAAP